MKIRSEMRKARSQKLRAFRFLLLSACSRLASGTSSHLPLLAAALDFDAPWQSGR